MTYMKKLFPLILTVLLIASSLTFVSSAANAPTVLWDFGKETSNDMEAAIAEFNSINMDYDLSHPDYGLFTATNSDPYVGIAVNVDDVAKIQWAKIRVKNPSPATAVEFFAKTDGSGHSLAGPECTHVDIVPNDNTWRTYICYLPNANLYTANTYKADTSIDAWNWQGTCSGIRFDAMWRNGDDGADAGGSMTEGDYIKVDYVAFFASKDDAINFRPEMDSAITPIQFEEGPTPADLTQGLVNENPPLDPDVQLLWDFGKYTGAAIETAIADAGNAVTALEYDTAERNYWTFTAKDLDPNVMIAADVADVSSIQWAKVRVKNPSPATAIELFAKTDGSGHSITGPECTHISIIPNVDVWQTYIVYLPNANIYTSTNIKGTALDAWNWQGACSGIRLDPMWKGADGDMADGDKIQIDYIAFFAVKSGAEAFRAGDDAAITPVEFEAAAELPDLSAAAAAAQEAAAAVAAEAAAAAEAEAAAAAEAEAAAAADAEAAAAEEAAPAAAEGAAETAAPAETAAAEAEVNTGLIVGIAIVAVVIVVAVIVFLVSKKKKAA
jgi:hypothetical protein